MKLRAGLLGLAALLLFASDRAYAKDQAAYLKQLIAKAKFGEVVKPPPGVYPGPFVISKPIVLDGGGEVTIDAQGHGSAIVLRTDGATIQNLTLRNTGELHNDLDSGVQVRGSFNVIKDNIIDDCLFGIDLSESHNNIIRRNVITSKELPLGLRGDGIRLWYSHRNEVTHNVARDVRDTVVWYSEDNHIAHNEVYDSRYGLHFMYSHYNLVEHNKYHHNSVGIFLMYSDSVVVRQNEVAYGRGSYSMGIGFKEASGINLTDNRVLYNGTGMYFDVSPLQPDLDNFVQSNLLAYNDIGIRFHNDWVGNHLKNNIFKDNFTQVAVNTWATVKRNDWEGNYWDDYQAFDLDRDGVGDYAYRKFLYADRIWMDVPEASFFRASPVLSLLDFLERLLPFTDPLLLLEDKQPIMVAGTGKELEMPVRGGDAGEESEDEEERFDPFGLHS